MAMQHLNVPPDNHVKVLDGQGWVGLIDHLGSETTIVNAARVSFGKLKTEMNEKDVGLLRYLIENAGPSGVHVQHPLSAVHPRPVAPSPDLVIQ